jgi:hypothetical protein
MRMLHLHTSGEVYPRAEARRVRASSCAVAFPLSAPEDRRVRAADQRSVTTQCAHHISVLHFPRVDTRSRSAQPAECILRNNSSKLFELARESGIEAHVAGMLAT